MLLRRAMSFVIAVCAVGFSTGVFGYGKVTADRRLLGIYCKQHPDRHMFNSKYTQAIDAMEHGKRKTAKKLLDELAKEDPKCPGVWISLGTYFMWTEDYAQAVAMSSKAIPLMPNDPDGYRRRGLQYIGIMKYPEAIADYSKALKMDPKHIDSLRMRADCYKAQKKYDLAIQDLEALLKVDPRSEGALYLRATIYQQMGEYKKAIAADDVILKFYPEDDQALVQRGSCNMKLQDYKTAVVDFTKALASQPDNPEYCLTQRALAYDKLGKKDLAEKDRAKAKAVCDY